MKLLSPTESKRLNEVTGFVCLAIGLLVLFSLVSYRTYDPSWNTAAGHVHPQNLVGYVGAYLADLLLQTFGLSALLFPVCAFFLGWKWIRSETMDSPGVKLTGFMLLGSSVCAGLGEWPSLHVFGLPASGVVGMLVSHWLVAALNRAGAVLVTLTALIVSVYLVSTFTLSKLDVWFGGPLSVLGLFAQRIKDWLGDWRERRLEKRREMALLRAESRAAKAQAKREPITQIMEPGERAPAQPLLEFEPDINNIPICPIEEPPAPAPAARRAPRAV